MALDVTGALFRLSKHFLLRAAGLFFSVYLTKHYLSSPRNLEAGRIDWADLVSGHRQYRNSQWHLRLLILKSRRQRCEEASFKKVSQLPSFVRSSSWTRLLGGWLMRAWRASEGHILWLAVHKNAWRGEVQTVRAGSRWGRLNDHAIINQSDPEVILRGSEVRGY